MTEKKTKILVPLPPENKGWKIKKIKETCEEARRNEKKSFMIVYSELDSSLSGYVQSITQNFKVFNGSLTPDELKELKRHYPGVWTGTQKGAFLPIEKPYLTLDGVLAKSALQHKGALTNYKCDILLETLTISGSEVIKAKIVSELRGTSEAFAVITKDDKKEDSTGIELAASSAIRKAFNYMGYGRFPTYSTKYGEDKSIEEFRKFKHVKATIDPEKVEFQVVQTTDTKGTQGDIIPVGRYTSEPDGPQEYVKEGSNPKKKKDE